MVDRVECDIVCTGRFHDLLEKQDSVWRIVLRQPTYERDRLDVVNPAETLHLDERKLSRFPVGYRHLAYAQEQIGYEVKTDMPGLKGSDTESLYEHCREWLRGGGSRWRRN